MKYFNQIVVILVIVTGVLTAKVSASEAEIMDVNVIPQGDRMYTFDVTLRHADEGWNHYANKWDIVTAQGEVLGNRVLFHPHVNEQPFTRSLSNVHIPRGIDEVFIRAYDSEHGQAQDQYRAKLP